MQYNQQYFVPNCGPVQAPAPFNQIMSEVIPVLNADGTIHFFAASPPTRFMTMCNPQQQSPPLRNSCSAQYINPSSDGWFGKNCQNVNQFPSIPYNCEMKRPELSLISNVAPNNGYNGFPLKFHSDACTSTTDLHYFFPNLRKALVNQSDAMTDLYSLPYKPRWNEYETMECDVRYFSKGTSCCNIIREKKKPCRCGFANKTVVTVTDQSCGPESRFYCERCSPQLNGIKIGIMPYGQGISSRDSQIMSKKNSSGVLSIFHENQAQ